MDEGDMQAYIKKHKVCELMDGLVAGLLASQPSDPILGAITLLCEGANVKPPAACPKLVTRAVGTTKPKEKDKEKEKKGKIDPREEALNRVAAEKEKKKKDEDEGMNFANAF
eukprot:TRINITY_DN7022_c0_g2_i1.p1 TRINITY_DN7022_c0_g2~~TRINITY_DN7022_c0_g2_i1.p1  ORF type:complete len:112 (+),score=32.31 TRINITY_DN7022_c0_g2_i1:43-378(+)